MATKKLEKKLYQCTGIKADAQGKISLVFGTMNVIDHDGDVTIPGAIGDPQKVRMSAYNHSSWGESLPVGKGIIYEKGDDMLFDGQFFLNTAAGKETYETVKSMEDLQEYSYGFDITEAGFGQFGPDDQEVRFLKGLKVYEVSPVLLGAGLNTRTLAIKGQSVFQDDPLVREVQRQYGKALFDKIDDEIMNGTEGDESKTYAEHAEMLLSQVEDFVKRSQSIADLRAEKGKDKSSDQNKGRLIDIAKALTEAADGLLDFATDHDEDTEVAKQVALLLEEHDTRQLIGVHSGT